MESAGGRTLLLGISSELGLLQPAVLQLAQRIRSAIDPAGMAATLRAAAQRVHTVIGPAMCTARSTMPSLIDDDFAAGRTLPIHGVVFSHTELVLLLAVAGMPEPATGG